MEVHLLLGHQCRGTFASRFGVSLGDMQFDRDVNVRLSKSSNICILHRQSLPSNATGTSGRRLPTVSPSMTEIAACMNIATYTLCAYAGSTVPAVPHPRRAVKRLDAAAGLRRDGRIASWRLECLRASMKRVEYFRTCLVPSGDISRSERALQLCNEDQYSIEIILGNYSMCGIWLPQLDRARKFIENEVQRTSSSVTHARVRPSNQWLGSDW